MKVVGTARAATDFAIKGAQGNSRDPAALLVLGLAHERCGRWKAAATAFGAALRRVEQAEAAGVADAASVTAAKAKLAANLGRCLAKVGRDCGGGQRGCCARDLVRLLTVCACCRRSTPTQAGDPAGALAALEGLEQSPGVTLVRAMVRCAMCGLVRWF